MTFKRAGLILILIKGDALIIFIEAPNELFHDGAVVCYGGFIV